MKKVHEFTGIWAVLTILSFVLMLSGMAWCTYGYFQTWDLIMSKKELFIYSWKGLAIMILGYVLFQFCLKKAK